MVTPLNILAYPWTELCIQGNFLTSLASCCAGFGYVDQHGRIIRLCQDGAFRDAILVDLFRLPHSLVTRFPACVSYFVQTPEHGQALPRLV
jgi:hypothetical protein